MSIDALNFERVHFRKTALRTVVAQLRFNQLFRIGIQPPVDFQESIRTDFPAVETTRETQIGLVSLGAGDVPLQMPEVEGSTWRFKSPDGKWIASLSSASVGLETTAYATFQEFEAKFHQVVGALTQHYAVDVFTRVGLRYINLFERGDGSPDWSKKFNRGLLGPLGDDSLGEHVTESRQQFQIARDDWFINVRHGLEATGSYRLDLDHATTTPSSRDDAQARIREFENRIYQVFRWALSDEMYQEMEPVPDV